MDKVDEVHYTQYFNENFMNRITPMRMWMRIEIGIRIRIRLVPGYGGTGPPLGYTCPSSPRRTAHSKTRQLARD